MPQPLRVLAIDGGGIRGIIPATVLAELERRCRRPVAELFDLIAGTSTGGILALALTAPGREDQPRYTAEQLIRLYLDDGPKIFSRSLLRRLTSLDGYLDERYDDTALESALEARLGDSRLGQALTPVMVTGYSLEERRPFFFKSARALENPAENHLMRVAARATAAAPSYFEPERVASEAGDVGVIDGGVCVVNPAMSAFAEAWRDGARDILIASLGTGEQTRPIELGRARGWGALEWVRPLLDVVFDGMSDVADYQLRHMLPADRYFRLQVELRDARDELDDASPRNLAALQRDAGRLLEEQAERIEALADALAPA